MKTQFTIATALFQIRLSLEIKPTQKKKRPAMPKQKPNVFQTIFIINQN